MARNRQRAKQRQAARRAERLARRGAAPAGSPQPRTQLTDPDGAPQSAATERAQFELEAGAPPEELGRSDIAVHSTPEAEEVEAGVEEAEEVEAGVEEVEEVEAGVEEVEEELEEEEELEDYDPEDEEQPYEPAAAKGAVTISRDEAARARERERGRVLGFLANVRAELQRVQWPNRQQVTTLTGVVLGFVLIAGGYLGLLDAIFSRVIQAIL